VQYFVYILYSAEIDSYYIGQTKHIEQRLNRHNNGYENYTSKGIPWVLVWKGTKPTRTEAQVLEKKLKNLSKERLKQFIEKYKEGREPNSLSRYKAVNKSTRRQPGFFIYVSDLKACF
jgi:putative endonuclease